MPRFAARLLSIVLAISIAIPPELQALVNPSLQPSHLIDRHRVVLVGTVSGVDQTTGSVTVAVGKVVRGAYAPPQLTIIVPAALRADADAEGSERPGLLRAAWAGGTVVAFLGKARVGARKDRGLLYLGGSWHTVGIPDPPVTGQVLWEEGHGDNHELWGTFNGDPERLAELVQDAEAGRLFFPARPFTAFAPEVVLARAAGPVAGVALVDVNGDGRLDAYACSQAGDRLLIQQVDGAFRDAGIPLGLTGSCTSSVGAADADGDGRIDLLLDGGLRRGTVNGFGALERLADIDPARVLVATFAEINGDGWPDVLAALTSGGLALAINPGNAGGPWRDGTAQAGLPTEGPAGLFSLGDLNDDGRTDVVFAAGKGPIHLQRPDGTFAVAAVLPGLDLGRDGRRSGAGTIAALWNQVGAELALPGDTGLAILAWRNDRTRSLAGYGNEIKISGTGQLATLAEDLNADGRIDLFTFGRGGCGFHTNRGYGTFMVEALYATDVPVFPGAAFAAHLGGVAAGDVDGDGAIDLLLGAADGTVNLLRNRSLDSRRATENPSAQDASLFAMRHLRIAVRGRGTVGADITVSGTDGRLIARRSLGTAVLSGCRGPDEAVVTVPAAGKWTVRVRFTDGVLSEQTVDVTDGRPPRLTFQHP